MMASGKLRIIKFEDGSNYKSIYITIPDEDSSTDVKYGEWTESTVQPTFNSEISSRLVVKIVSGEETKKIDLDDCSKMLEDTNRYVHNTQEVTTSTDTASEANNGTALYKEKRSDCDDAQDNSWEYNPLDQSLQRVKENNARIMENINMLNRTLNYTKKKEIMDIICPKSMRTYSCRICGKCFVYETGLRRHFAIRHAISEMQPRWQIVWTCIQCFQVWPQQSQALEHCLDCCKSLPSHQEYVREIKTSLLLQCEFCEKVYTSIPRLLRHSKMHSAVRNYECNTCNLTFISYKMAEQHWLLCPWFNTNYCFSLPKMLLCNGCDRKFRNYEQLYNHRYKVGHFMLKSCTYQCELCAVCYDNIPQIINHRSQHLPQDTSAYNAADIMINIESVGTDNYKGLIKMNTF